MEESYDNLISLLEASVKKNGEKPLTNLWLLNILKKVREEAMQEGPSEGDGPDW